MYLTKPNLYFTPELQDKIVRYKRYRVNSFVSVPLNCVTIVLRGAPKKKRHNRGCFTLAQYFLPYILTGRDVTP